MYLIEEEYRDHELEDGDEEKEGKEEEKEEGEEDGEKKEKTNPFHHDPADVVVGTVKIPLDGIAYNQVDDDDFFIKDHTERSQGTLELCVQSCDASRT
jgi:hypothetical protein